MSFLSETSASQKIGVIIAAIVGGLIVRFVMAGGIEEYYNPSKQIENRIVEAMEARPGDLAVLQAMRDYFPLEYDDLLESMTDAAMADAPAEDVMRAGSRELARFMARHPNDFAAAPEANLSEVLRTESALLEALLAEDPVACGDYIFGTMEPADPLSEETGKLIGEAAASKIKAMAAGRADQQLRLATTPSDLRKLTDTMRERGASAEQIALFTDNIDTAVLGSEEQCEAALHLVKAIEAQKPSSRALLVATFLTPIR
ncbi:MAG: hypothetical protein H6918_05985 [Sphingomonadaceae bacterium]|nr:hypothetical protein [Sphingomonadaceae bacterium]